jgi:hypothetical protein
LSAGTDKLLRMVEAQVWTVIGLLAATLIGTLVYLGGRIEALGARMDSRIDALGARMDSRIDGLSARIEEQGALLGDRIYELAVKLDDHLRWHAG